MIPYLCLHALFRRDTSRQPNTQRSEFPAKVPCKLDEIGWISCHSFMRFAPLVDDAGRSKNILIAYRAFVHKHAVYAKAVFAAHSAGTKNTYARAKKVKVSKRHIVPNFACAVTIVAVPHAYPAGDSAAHSQNIALAQHGIRGNIGSFADDVAKLRSLWVQHGMGSRPQGGVCNGNHKSVLRFNGIAFIRTQQQVLQLAQLARIAHVRKKTLKSHGLGSFTSQPIHKDFVRFTSCCRITYDDKLLHGLIYSSRAQQTRGVHDFFCIEAAAQQQDFEEGIFVGMLKQALQGRIRNIVGIFPPKRQGKPAHAQT